MTATRKSGANTGRGTDGRFARGNPGKPRGARHKATLAAEALLDGQAEALTQAAIAAALSGDTAALRLCLDRVLPVRRGRPVVFEPGSLESATDLATAARRLLGAVAAGALTPEEAQVVGAVIEQARRAFETEALERRLQAIETHIGAKP